MLDFLRQHVFINCVSIVYVVMLSSIIVNPMLDVG